MNTKSILAGEFVIALAFVSWGAIHSGYWPWPGTIVKMSLGFGVFALLEMFVPSFAVAMAGGVLLALFLKEYQAGINNYTGGTPQTPSFPLLTVGNGPKSKG